MRARERGGPACAPRACTDQWIARIGAPGTPSSAPGFRAPSGSQAAICVARTGARPWYVRVAQSGVAARGVTRAAAAVPDPEQEAGRAQRCVVVLLLDSGRRGGDRLAGRDHQVLVRVLGWRMRWCALTAPRHRAPRGDTLDVRHNFIDNQLGVVSVIAHPTDDRALGLGASSEVVRRPLTSARRAQASPEAPWIVSSGCSTWRRPRWSPTSTPGPVRRLSVQRGAAAPAPELTRARAGRSGGVGPGVEPGRQSDRVEQPDWRHQPVDAGERGVRGQAGRPQPVRALCRHRACAVCVAARGPRQGR